MDTSVHYFGDVRHRPAEMWWVVSAIGFATTLLMWIYNMVFKPIAGRGFLTGRLAFRGFFEVTLVLKMD